MTPIDLAPEGISRRRFLALLGASAALASGVTSSCSKIDRGAIVPYTRKPREVVPGVANHYASTFHEGMIAYAVLVTTREGRPIHIEGNDEHPAFKGKTSHRAIADILRLYDPERLQRPSIAGRPATWERAQAALLAHFRAAKEGGGAVAVFTPPVLSPTRGALLADLRRVVPGMVHIPFDAMAPHAERAATAELFGEPMTLRYHFDRADVLVSFERDFLGTDGNVPVATREFAARRRIHGPGERMNRLWVCEGAMTLTGAKADHRFAVPPLQDAALAFALARTLNVEHGIVLPPGVRPELLARFDLNELADTLDLPAQQLRALAADLARAGKRALVMAGSAAPREAHVAAHVLNTMLGAEALSVDPAPDVCTFAQLQQRLAEMKASRFRAAVFWDVNVGYVCPEPELWAAAMAAMPNTAFLGVHADETARACDVVLPEHHWLESWGDYDSGAEVLALQQPTVGPLYDTRQGEDVFLDVIRALGGTTRANYHEYLKARWQEQVYPAGTPVPFERFWSAALHDGVLVHAAASRPMPSLRAAAVEAAATSAAAPVAGGFELVLRADPALYDGRYANNGWLQELPDPITKVTWSNPLAVAPADARRLGVRDGDVVRMEAMGRSAELPVIVQRGQCPGVLSAALGYGRETLSVARQVGVNLYPFVKGHPGAARAVQVTRIGKQVALPITQGHQTMQGRDIVRTVALAEYARGQLADDRGQEPPTLYPQLAAGEHKWGLVIDLAACVGCGGCMVACQSENNVPVVGPEQVLKGREMHWIRIDRYYEGEPAAPRVVHEPMLCQQCDNAPCENVCPVNATNHSPDGLSQMAYNRCVGTRYCANNCPYKVRRFNFLDFTGATPPAQQLVYNPEVTVRPRGVMEKCSFCVQRIEDVKLRAKAEGRAIRDGEITTACAAACPAEAITFGDLKDAGSAVTALSRNPRGYQVLAELGVRPAVTYLANITNAVENGATDAI